MLVPIRHKRRLLPRVPFSPPLHIPIFSYQLYNRSVAMERTPAHSAQRKPRNTAYYTTYRQTSTKRKTQRGCATTTTDAHVLHSTIPSSGGCDAVSCCLTVYVLRCLRFVEMELSLSSLSTYTRGPGLSHPPPESVCSQCDWSFFLTCFCHIGTIPSGDNRIADSDPSEDLLSRQGQRGNVPNDHAFCMIPYLQLSTPSHMGFESKIALALVRSRLERQGGQKKIRIRGIEPRAAA